MVHKEKKGIKSQPARDRCSWEYMFNLWLVYAAENPDKRNQVPVAMMKLSGWVKEQCMLFGKGFLAQDWLDLLTANQFYFHPRLTAKETPKLQHYSLGKLLDVFYINVTYSFSYYSLFLCFCSLIDANRSLCRTSIGQLIRP
jgi:hypothetical protein